MSKKLIHLLIHKDANIGKLATREDPKHIHKTLGILSVASFFYRYGYVYPTTGNLGFGDGDLLDWATICVHTLLALSSIIFRVPSKRIDSKPMVIYEEYRQHAMVFTLRCFSVFVAATLFPTAPVWAVPLLVAAHHALADDVTRRHGSGNTAVRAVSDKLKVSTFYKNVGKLYSFYQFLAIASHICPSAYLPDMAYNAIIAIQSSAFMMTLYRKRIITGKTHMIVYSMCLVLSAYHIVRVMGLARVSLVAATFALRVNMPRQYSNKYALWTLFLFAPHAISYLLNNSDAIPSFLSAPIALAAPLLSKVSAEAFEQLKALPI